MPHGFFLSFFVHRLGDSLPCTLAFFNSSDANSNRANHLQFMMMYGMSLQHLDAASENPWVTHLLEGGFDDQVRA